MIHHPSLPSVDETVASSATSNQINSNNNIHIFNSSLFEVFKFNKTTCALIMYDLY